jgi:hypothetical protein
MFLRPYKRYKDGKTHTYYAVVESVRTEAGPRQHVVAYLGELNRDQERRWQRTLVCYNRQGDVRQLRLFPDDEQIPLPDDPDVVRIRLSSVGRTNARSFGDVWLARWLWNWLHLDEIVARHLPQGRETVAPADIVAIEVINRLCGPCSEFALAEHWYASTGLEDLLGVPDREVTKDRLYRTLDDLVEALKRLERQVVSGRLKKRDKILERVGRLKERFPKARPFVTITVSESPCQLQWIWDVPKFKAALARDGVSLMSTNHDGWTPTEFWETYMQLTTVENAFRVLKSHLLLRPVWRHYAGRTKAHVFICVLAYTLVEHLGPTGPASRTGDLDPQARSGIWIGFASTAADDAGGDPAGVGQDQDRRHPAGNDRRTETGPAASGPPRSRAGSHPHRPESADTRALNCRFHL